MAGRPTYFLREHQDREQKAAKHGRDTKILSDNDKRNAANHILQDKVHGILKQTLLTTTTKKVSEVAWARDHKVGATTSRQEVRMAGDEKAPDQ